MKKSKKDKILEIYKGKAIITLVLGALFYLVSYVMFKSYESSIILAFFQIASITIESISIIYFVKYFRHKRNK